jgi:hypothetical protein
MASAQSGVRRRSAEIQRRLLALADSEALSVKEWWMVDLACRQGIEVVAAGQRVGVGEREAWTLWRGLEVLAAGAR